MKAHECFHCKRWIEAGVAHDCWTTTEAALTRHLPEELQDAWERLRETAAEFGDQRIYASHHSIMFSRKACYFFVRPHPKRLELCIFLGRTIRSPLVRKTIPSSRAKVAHVVHIIHRDQVEPPLTDWLREAYAVSPSLGLRATGAAGTATAAKKTPRPKTARTKPVRRKAASKKAAR
jgi:hypothetical protein